ncbi:hypothetical protein NMG60_11005016 [Bertholletia excelsa]
MRFDWKIVAGTLIAFFGAALGTVGGVGGGGIFVPMLSLLLGFDTKSSTALSKCLIMGASAATVFYNFKQRHPTLDLPIIDYDLAVLFQPMLVLGISVGVTLNVIFPEWMVTIFIILFFPAFAIKAFVKGVDTWKKETILKKEATERLASEGKLKEAEIKPSPEETSRNEVQTESDEAKKSRVSVMENLRWKELSILVAVWVIILVLQIVKNNTTTCSASYWALDLLQIPVAIGASGYEVISLYSGRRTVASTGGAKTKWQVHKLVLYCFFAVFAGVIGGLLGIGGGGILGSIYLEMGAPPQVSSATATFAMLFSSSMSVIEYYLLRRFPVPYALYLAGVATIAAFVGQHVAKKVISLLGRASLIIFILSTIASLSAITLGGVGISRSVAKMKRHEYMGFGGICSYHS